ncbi:hypothetical protein [Bacillus sp. OTU530]|uniref:hypothetical protein n=1 Tax=Bacillus sp. OTU530 TaxID=3043862 RepID=UPI00313AD344
MAVLLFCNTDEEGNLTASLVGERVIPLQQYSHFFFIDDKDLETVKQELTNYKVINQKLILTENTAE